MNMFRKNIVLLVLSAAVIGDVFCVNIQQIASHFVIQDNRIAVEPVDGAAFGTFLSDIPTVQHTPLSRGAVSQYGLVVTPKSLDDLHSDFCFSSVERGFHDLLHIGGTKSVFLTLIK